MTLPAGTVMLGAVVIVPTTSCAVVSAVVAAACVSPTTFGALTCGRPDETVSAIALPTTTSAPAVGFWLMTDPAGTVMLDAVVIVPSTSCAVVSAGVAAACVSPTTFGALTCGRPVDTVSAIALPTTTSAPAAGDWLMTLPAGTVMLAAVEIVSTTSCAPVIAVVAAAWVRPTTSGALTCGRPVDTVNPIALPTMTSLAAAGFWLMTLPAGTVMLAAVEIVPSTSCALVIAVIAAAWVRPTKAGALMCGRPLETVSAIALPTTTSLAAAGFWLMTLPA